MSESVAQDLKRKYLNQLAKEGNVYTLMDFFCNEKAKRSLHDADLDMKQVSLNFSTRRASVSQGIRASMV